MNQSTHKKLSFRFSMFFFIVAILIFGAIIGNILPPIQMLGMKEILPNLGLAVSKYIGGVGISMVLGNSGVLIGFVFRRIAITIFPKSKSSFTTFTLKEIQINSAACGVGLLFTCWYFWSFLHPT